MVALTAVAVTGVVVVVATAGAGTPLVVGAGTALGAGSTAGAGVAITSAAATGSAVAGSAGIGATVGATVGAGAAAAAGATAGGAATAAGIGAAVGSAAAAGTTSAGAGAAGLAAAGVASGPVGWLVLGASQEQETYTYDCWKQVLHDESLEPSNGKLLRDVAADPRIKQVTTSLSDDSSLPEIILENIWDERFQIEYLILPSSELAAHAVCLE